MDVYHLGALYNASILSGVKLAEPVSGVTILRNSQQGCILQSVAA